MDVKDKLVTVEALDEAFRQSTATGEPDPSLFKNRDSHISTFNARRSGRTIMLSCQLLSGVSNGTKLLDIDPSIEPAYLDRIAPLYKGSGEQITYGSVWIERNNKTELCYYGTETTASQLYFALSYIIR